MQKTVKYSLVAVILLTLTVAGLWVTTSNNASAQAASGSFNPQTQFPVGSTVSITSVYGIATVPSHPFNASGMPGLGNRNWNQTYKNHSWNQTGGFRSLNQTLRNQRHLNQTINHSWNETLINLNRNGTFMPPVTTYSASITISAQVANDTANGGIQWTVQSGSIVVNGNTFTITGGRGQMSSLGRLVIGGTATDSNGNTLRWQLQGLAAMYNGAVIANLNGSSFTAANNAFEHANLTYLATIS
jgi:hypothetical protein